MDKIKILFLLHSLSPGGAERQFLNLYHRLDREKFFPIVVTYKKGIWDNRIKGEFHCLNIKNSFDIISILFGLRKIIQETSPHIIYGLLGDACTFSFLVKKRDMNLIWGIRASNMDYKGYSLFSRLVFKLNARLSYFTDAIIVNSKTGMDYHIKVGYCSKKMFLIYNGIDTDFFIKDNENGKKLRKALGIDDGVKLIGRVGRYDFMKDYPLFIEACEKITSKYSNVRFLVVGSGCDNETIKDLAKAKGIKDRLYIFDIRDDLPSIYSACDITVSSSRFGEGFPNVIAESMSCETPCVATDVGDSRVIVDKYGLIVPPQRADLLTNACLEMLNNNKDSEMMEIGKMAREHIVKNFSIDKMVKETEGVFERFFPRGTF